MKKLIVFTFLHILLNSAYGQSFLKVRSNLFKFGVPSSDYKLGLGIGHERLVLDKSFIKILLGQDIDYKHTSFNFYDGGLGGGDFIYGNINFLNGQLNVKTRIGKRLFYELGLFSSLSLIKKITKGGVTITQTCGAVPPSQTPICPDPINKSITNESSYFGSLDFGPLLGIGYTFKDYKFILDGQFGLKNIISLQYSQLTTIQFNLSVAKSINFKLRELKFNKL